MIVTTKTTYEEFQPVEKYIKEQAIADLKKAAERTYVSMYELTFAQFLQVCGGDFSSVLGDMSKPTVMQVYWCKRFEDFKKEFENALNATNIPQNAKQKMASEGLPKQTFAESLLIFSRRYFGLHNFREAEQLTLGDIMIARKDAYNTAMYEIKIQRIEMQEIKNRKQ